MNKMLVHFSSKDVISTDACQLASGNTCAMRHKQCEKPGIKCMSN